MEKVLYHHGIKGQKWGVKNGPPYPLEGPKRSSPSRGKSTVLDDYKKKIVKKRQDKIAAQEKLKKMYDYKHMTDDELRSAINRADLERDYVSKVLPKQKESTMKRLAKKFLKESGDSLVSQVAVPLSTLAVKKVIAKSMSSDDEDAANDLLNALKLSTKKKKEDNK